MSAPCHTPCRKAKHLNGLNQHTERALREMPARLQPIVLHAIIAAACPKASSAVQTGERHTEALQNLRPDPRSREPGSVVRQSKDYRHIVLSRTHRIQGQPIPRGLWPPRCRLV